MFSQCDAWPTALSSRLEQCSRPAQYSLTIEAYGEVYIVYRCQPCRDELVTKAESDGIEILDETPLPLCDLVITGKR
ncbi:MAG: hypothetical protein KJ077_25750 [Anaerolineae bacterium]|nr:hypothetical protein [Anaerolineae bacterium]